MIMVIVAIAVQSIVPYNAGSIGRLYKKDTRANTNINTKNKMIFLKLYLK